MQMSQYSNNPSRNSTAIPIRTFSRRNNNRCYRALENRAPTEEIQEAVRSGYDARGIDSECDYETYDYETCELNTGDIDGFWEQTGRICSDGGAERGEGEGCRGEENAYSRFRCVAIIYNNIQKIT